MNNEPSESTPVSNPSEISIPNKFLTSKLSPDAIKLSKDVYSKTIVNTLIWKEQILSPELKDNYFGEQSETTSQKTQTKKLKPQLKEYVTSDPNLLLYCVKYMPDGKLYEIFIRDYHNSIVIKLR